MRALLALRRTVSGDDFTPKLAELCVVNESYDETLRDEDDDETDEDDDDDDDDDDEEDDEETPLIGDKSAGIKCISAAEPLV